MQRERQRNKREPCCRKGILIHHQRVLCILRSYVLYVSIFYVIVIIPVVVVVVVVVEERGRKIYIIHVSTSSKFYAIPCGRCLMYAANIKSWSRVELELVQDVCSSRKKKKDLNGHTYKKEKSGEVAHRQQPRKRSWWLWALGIFKKKAKNRKRRDL